MQERSHFLRRREAFSLQQLSDARQTTNLRPGNTSIWFVVSRRDDPTSLHKSDYLGDGPVARHGSFSFVAGACEHRKRFCYKTKVESGSRIPCFSQSFRNIESPSLSGFPK